MFRSQVNIGTLWCLLGSWFCWIECVKGSHFRGAHFWWEPANNGDPREVIISFRIAWRRSYQHTYCDDATKESGELIGPRDAGILECVEGCGDRPVRIENVQFVCTDYSESEDWSSGTRNYTYTFPGTDRYILRWDGRGWSDTLIQGSDQPWSFNMVVDLKLRHDEERINTPPTVTMETIVRLPQGCYNTINLPVDDRDGDKIRCRAPNPDNHECGGICEHIHGVNIDVVKCQMFFADTMPAGLYAVPVQVEDFLDESSLQPLSSVPLQFIVEIYETDPETIGEKDEVCILKPEFVSPTPRKDSCRYLNSGERFSFIIVARSKNLFTRIDEIRTQSIEGMSKSSLRRYGNNPRDFYVEMTWTPNTNNIGANTVCFSAKDSSVPSVTSNQRCIFLSVDSYPPRPQYLDASIIGDTKVIFIQYDQQVYRSTKESFITFYDFDQGFEVLRMDNRNEMISYIKNRLYVDLPSYISWEGYYTILMDQGIVRGDGRCTESDAVMEADRFKFTFDDVNTPTTSVPKPPSTTTESMFTTLITNITTTVLTTSNTEKLSSPTPDDRGVFSNPNKKDKNYLWVVLLVVAACLLAALVAFLAFVIKRTNNKKRTDPYVTSRSGDYYSKSRDPTEDFYKSRTGTDEFDMTFH